MAEKIDKGGAGETGQQLREYMAFPGGLSLVPSTHMGWLTATCDYS